MGGQMVRPAKLVLLLSLVVGGLSLAIGALDWPASRVGAPSTQPK
jgi:hypothetical protein